MRPVFVPMVSLDVFDVLHVDVFLHVCVVIIDSSLEPELHVDDKSSGKTAEQQADDNAGNNI